MALKYGIFPGVKTGEQDGIPISDRAVDDQYFARYHSMFLSNGIYGKVADCFQVLAKEGLIVRVRPGDIFINGWYAYDLSEAELTVPSPSENMVYRVVAQLSQQDRDIHFYVKAGSNGTAPALSRYSDTYELCLAEISVARGATAITQANIRDTRLDEALCGIVTGVVQQVDTTTLLAQMESWFSQRKAAELSDFQHWFETFSGQSEREFHAWFQGIKSILDESTAGNLLSLINGLTANKADKIKGGAENHLLSLGADGNPKDSGSSAAQILLAAYPVGSIYLSTTAASPATLFGGTWERWGQGRALIGVNESDTDFTANKAGGAKSAAYSIASHAHSIAAHTHTTSAVSLSAAQMPLHAHSISHGHGHNLSTAGAGAHQHVFGADKDAAFGSEQGYSAHRQGISENPGVLIATNSVDNHSHGITGSITDFFGNSAAAGSGQPHTHGNTDGTALTTAAAGAASGSISTLQPYITCYMWQRTA